MTEMLLALERYQVQLAKCKVMAGEEQKVVADDWANLFKADPDAMATAINTLNELGTAMLHFCSVWTSDAIDINEITSQVKVLSKQQVDSTLKLWSSCFIKAVCMCLLIDFELLLLHWVASREATIACILINNPG